jgi:hypothetical protein
MKRIWLVLALVLAVATAAYEAAAASANHGHSSKVTAHSKGKGLSHRAVKGTVAGVDTTASTISLNLKKGGTFTVTYTADTKVRRNGHKVAVTDLQVGDRALVVRGKDGTAKKVLAHSKRVFNGTVAGVDTTAGTITLNLKKGGTAGPFTVTTDTKIIVNDQPGQLSDIQVGWHANVKVADDGKTATRVEADNESESGSDG